MIGAVGPPRTNVLVLNRMVVKARVILKDVMGKNVAAATVEVALRADHGTDRGGDCAPRSSNGSMRE
jgi:hypothetical protein